MFCKGRLVVLWRRLVAGWPARQPCYLCAATFEISVHAMLTDITVRVAQPRAKPYRLFDGRGLYLCMRPTGTRVWRWKYRQHGKERLLVIGRYPQVSLKEARAQCDAARDLVAAGKDLRVRRRVESVTTQLDTTRLTMP